MNTTWQAEIRTSNMCSSSYNHRRVVFANDYVAEDRLSELRNFFCSLGRTTFVHLRQMRGLSENGVTGIHLQEVEILAPLNPISVCIISL